MSAVIKTSTPFVNVECLCKALEALGHTAKIQGDKVITSIRDRRLGFQEFRRDKSGKYALFGYSYYDKNQAGFVQEIETHYHHFYQQKLEELERLRKEEEIRRIEEERLAFIAKQKERITQKAKELGYTVREKRVKEKTKLILVRHTY